MMRPSATRANGVSACAASLPSGRMCVTSQPRTSRWSEMIRAEGGRPAYTGVGIGESKREIPDQSRWPSFRHMRSAFDSRLLLT